MIRLLAKYFVKDYKNYANPATRRGYGSLCGIMGICLLLSMVYETPVWVLIPAGLLFIEVIVFSILIRRAGK